jgi:hypothetical protein
MAKNRNQAKKMASKGASVKEIRKETGVNRAAAQKFTQNAASRTSTTTTPNDQGPPGNTAPRTNPGISTSPPRTTPEIKGLGQGIRIAGGGGGLSKSELNTLMESGKNQGQIIRQLDKVNAKLKDQDKGSINLKSGAANMLIRQANKNRTNLLGRRDFEFGTGRIGQQLGDMSGLNTPITSPNRRVFNSPQRGEEFTPEFLDRGMDLTGRGATGKTVRGVGKGYDVPDRFLPKPEPEPELEPQPQPEPEPEEVFEEPVIPEPEPEEEQDRSASSGAGGLDLASWATGFKKARSARQRAGRPAQGLASQKKNPFKSWA